MEQFELIPTPSNTRLYKGPKVTKKEPKKKEELDELTTAEYETIIGEQANVISALQDTTRIAELIIMKMMEAMDTDGEAGVELGLIAGQKPKFKVSNGAAFGKELARVLQLVDGVVLSIKPGYGLKITPHFSGEE